MRDCDLLTGLNAASGHKLDPVSSTLPAPVGSPVGVGKIGADHPGLGPPIPRGHKPGGGNSLGMQAREPLPGARDPSRGGHRPTRVGRGAPRSGSREAAGLHMAARKAAGRTTTLMAPDSVVSRATGRAGPVVILTISIRGGIVRVDRTPDSRTKPATGLDGGEGCPSHKGGMQEDNLRDDVGSEPARHVPSPQGLGPRHRPIAEFVPDGLRHGATDPQVRRASLPRAAQRAGPIAGRSA